MFGLATCLGLLAILLWGTWRRPAVGLAAVLCLYGLKQWGQNSSLFLTQNRTLVNFAVAGIVAVGLLRSQMSQQKHEWLLSPAVKLGIALYLYAAFSLGWTPLLPAALNQWSLHVPYILTIVVLSPLLFANADDVQAACRWTVLVGGAVCLLALFAGTWGARGLLVQGDLYGMETNPLAIASLGGTVLIMAMVALPTPSKLTIKILYAVLAVAGLAVILRSGSRGQLIAAVLSALLGWHLASRRQHLGTLLVAALAGTAMAAIGWWIWDDLGADSTRWSQGQSTEDVTGRLNLGMVLLSEAFSNPMTLLFGLGNSSSFYYIGGYPHVAALEIVAEEGLIGAGLYVGIFIVTLRSVRDLLALAKTEQQGAVRYVVAVLTALFIFEWVLTLKQGTLLSCTYFIAYAAILGRLQLWQQTEIGAAGAPVTEQDPTLAYPNLMR